MMSTNTNDYDRDRDEIALQVFRPLAYAFRFSSSLGAEARDGIDRALHGILRPLSCEPTGPSARTHLFVSGFQRIPQRGERRWQAGVVGILLYHGKRFKNVAALRGYSKNHMSYGCIIPLSTL